MKKIVGFSLLVILFTGCLKNKNNNNETCNYTDVSVTAPQSEVDSVQAYLTSKNIFTASKLGSGLFYTISSPGTGSAITNLCSSITVRYKGTLKNGVVFDETAGAETVSFQLGGVILGWQKGIPLIKEGGKITLYIPPSLGYGNQSVGSIPPNSILIFDIELLDIF